MSYTNVHEFTGRVTQKTDTKYFPSSAVVTKFNLAVKPPYKSDEPIYCSCEAWGKLAETAANWLEVGKVVTIQAELKIEAWTDKNTGEMRSKAVYKVNRLDMLSGAKKKDEVLEPAV